MMQDVRPCTKTMAERKEGGTQLPTFLAGPCGTRLVCDHPARERYDMSVAVVVVFREKRFHPRSSEERTVDSWRDG